MFTTPTAITGRLAVLARAAASRIAVGAAAVDRAAARASVRASIASAEVGQSMVEYAIVVALIALVALGAVQLLGGGIATVFTNILTRIQALGR